MGGSRVGGFGLRQSPTPAGQGPSAQPSLDHSGRTEFHTRDTKSITQKDGLFHSTGRTHVHVVDRH